MISSPLLQSNGHYCFVLFLTICFITSGYFLPTTTTTTTTTTSTTTTTTTIDHHNHSNHRHKQLQLQLQLQQRQRQHNHHLPIIVPAISRLHEIQPSHQHAIIRRAIQSQQQHLSFTNDYHTTTPTLKLVKKVNMLQIDDELKALKKKRKRLRQLREEVRELSEHLKNKHASVKTSSTDLLEKRKMKENHIRWRKQITTRVKAIMKRLKRLENEERKKLAKHLQISSLNFDRLQSSPHTLLITANKNFKIKRLHSFINQSKNGESGGICLGHNDCKPGLCCHRFSTMDANSSIASTVNICYQYMLKEGELCEDSCQCEARLNCFRNSNQLKDDKSMIKSKHNVYAICKKVSTSDIVNGIYLNAKDSSFHIKPTAHRQ
uniref:Phospholipase A(2) n=1 Tax=Wuchereria bancrofti TaxID=6293 RepID=A0AAF5Q3C9_WUCBA